MPGEGRTIRRGLAIVIAITVLSIPGTGRADDYPYGYGPFADDNGSVHEADVIALWEAGITLGCSETRFCPGQAVTRGQMATFLARALGLAGVPHGPFEDVASSPHEESINAIAAAQITLGCSETHFCPRQAVTREQMATFLARALGLAGVPDGPFEDVASSPHEESINAIDAAEITLGCSQTRFCPQESVTREQMASLLVRGFDLPAVSPLPACSEEVCGPWALVPEPPYTAEDWRPLVAHFFQEADVDLAVQVIECESGGNPDIRNASIGAAGLFQHLEEAWPDRAAAAGWPGASIYDPVANIAAGAWLVYQGGGWDHWPTCV